MKLDFTFEKYRQLINILKERRYAFYTFKDIVVNNTNLKSPHVILRHDVDRLPMRALKLARLEYILKIKSTYFFRSKPISFDEKIIKRIVDWGHEIGYHYENLSHAKGNYEKALNDFEKKLKILRKFYPIKTMCMHGSPMSKWDNRKLWRKNDYKKYGIFAEPYFDLDFNKILYITDASRTWNNDKVNLRDKVKTNYNFSFSTIFDIINLFEKGKLPKKVMINIHPHNWATNAINWYKIFIVQNTKNLIKRFIKR